MINELKNLTDNEADLLFRAPALVSVLASCSFNKIDKIQKADAIKLAHLKTFTANPLLLSFYDVVEKQFVSQFEKAAEKYFPYDDSKIAELRKDIDSINTLASKLDNKYAFLLYKSLDGYAKHVKKAAHSVFQDFIFPLPIEGLSS